MNVWIILVAIVIILLSSEIFSGLTYRQEVANFCKENGFEYDEFYERSEACWIDQPEKLIVKKAKCDIDFISLFTFQNPYRGCKFSKEIEVI